MPVRHLIMVIVEYSDERLIPNIISDHKILK